MSTRLNFRPCAVLLWSAWCCVSLAGETIPDPHPPPARIPTYRITNLGLIEGYEESLAYGINNSGEVVGVCWRTIFRDALVLEQTAFVYRDGVMSDLGTSEGHSGANAINDAGQIVGWNRLPNFTVRAFLFENEELFDLSQMGCNRCLEAIDINQQSQIIGALLGVPFLWENGSMTQLGSLEGFTTEVAAINDSGLIVGQSDVWVPFPPFRQPRAVVWAGIMPVELPRMNDSWSKAYDINDFGEIVGYSNGAVIWRNGEVEYLVDIPGSITGGPRAINNHGLVVGDGGSLSNQTGVLWKDGHRYDLPPLLPPNLIWRLESIADINDHGQIVGFGRHLIPYWRSAFVLTPINADANSDDTVDSLDYLQFNGCLIGPGTPVSAGCEALDLDLDGDVDFVDFRSVELAFLPDLGP